MRLCRFNEESLYTIYMSGLRFKISAQQPGLVQSLPPVIHDTVVCKVGYSNMIGLQFYIVTHTITPFTTVRFILGFKFGPFVSHVSVLTLWLHFNV